MRLGELLVREGLLDRQQVEQVLRAQVMWGGRFGTNAVELHMVDLDLLSRIIARQYGLPAAFSKHFAAADVEVQRELSPELAGQYACLPLRRVGKDRVVVASVAPLDGRARALVADQLGISFKGIIPAIAPELRIHYHLERVYGIPRDTRFLRSRKRSTVPSFDVTIVDVEDEDSGPTIVPIVPIDRARVDEPSDAIPEELPEFLTPKLHIVDPDDSDRRHYIPTLGEDGNPIARVPIKRHANGSVEMLPLSKPATLDDANRAIRRAADRETIARRSIDAVARFFPAKAGVLLVVRGDAAIGWTGFQCADQIAVAIDKSRLVPAAIGANAIARSPASELGAQDFLLLDALGAPDGDLVIVPIAVGGHVWCVLALAVEHGAYLEGIESISTAAATGFIRLLRHANR